MKYVNTAMKSSLKEATTTCDLAKTRITNLKTDIVTCCAIERIEKTKK